MANANNFETFKSEFNATIVRFADIAPTIPNDPCNQASVAADVNKLRRLIDLSLESAHCKDIVEEDMELLNYIVERTNLVLDFLDVTTSFNTEEEQPFDEEQFVANLQELGKSQFKEVAKLITGDIADFDRHDFLIYTAALNGISLGLGPILLIIAKILILIGSFILVTLGLLPFPNFLSLVSFLVKIDLDVRKSGSVEDHKTPNSGLGNVDVTQRRTYNLVHCKEEEVPLLAGQKMRIEFLFSPDNPKGRLEVSDEQGLLDILNPKESTQEILGPQKIKIHFKSKPGHRAGAIARYL